MTDVDNLSHDTSSTGSRLPAEIPWSGAPSGLGLSADPHVVAGDEDQALPPRPVRAAANDAAWDGGIIAEGQMDGEVNPERSVPWL